MLENPENSEVYRGRAEQARLAAKDLALPQHRQIFERLAIQYEAMAREAEAVVGDPARAN